MQILDKSRCRGSMYFRQKKTQYCFAIWDPFCQIYEAQISQDISYLKLRLVKQDYFVQNLMDIGKNDSFWQKKLNDSEENSMQRIQVTLM